MFKKLLWRIGHESIQVRTQTTKIIFIRLIPASGRLSKARRGKKVSAFKVT
jgi:hypothetical protein